MILEPKRQRNERAILCLWLLAAGALIGLDTSCSNSPPKGSLIQRINLSAILAQDGGGGTALLPLTSVETSAGYQVIDCQAIVSLTNGDRDVWSGRVMSNIVEEVVGFGGLVVGKGMAGTPARNSRQVDFETKKTMGEIRMYAFEIDTSKMGVVLVGMERPKRFHEK